VSKIEKTSKDNKNKAKTQQKQKQNKTKQKTKIIIPTFVIATLKLT